MFSTVDVYKKVESKVQSDIHEVVFTTSIKIFGKNKISGKYKILVKIYYVLRKLYFDEHKIFCEIKFLVK